MNRSKAVNEAIKDLYARLATAAGEKAIGRIKHYDDGPGAEAWVLRASRWLDQAGANATKWTYSRPKV